MRFFRFFPASALAMAACWGLAGAAHADALQDAGKLLKQGRNAQALEQIDGYLSSHPKDAQGRFLKGLVLTELNRLGEATAIFQKLTEDYPQLPEPYNNLAVIYAQQKQYDKAKQALEMAIRTHPAYATAHENLGDIYARMASQAYDKALQLDSSNTSAQTKLSMVRELMSNSSRQTGRPAVPTVVAAANTKLADARPVEVAKPIEPPKAAESAKPVEPPKPVEPAKPPEIKVADARPVETKPVAKPAELKPAEPSRPAEPAATPAKPPVNLTAEVSKAVEAWAAAWSKKDMKAYLGHYARDFRIPDRQSRSAWEAERTRRIVKPGAIQVSVDDIQVKAEGADQATARFRQYYKSAKFKSSGTKTLSMVRQDGRWLILEEEIN